MKKQKKKIPRYHLFRIILFTIFLYIMLVSPITTILLFKNSPLIVDRMGLDSTAVSGMSHDSLVNYIHTKTIADSLIPDSGHIQIPSDTLTASRIYYSEDSASVMINLSRGENENPFQSTSHPVFLLTILAAVIITLVLNIPFKRYLRKKRRKKPVSEKLEKYCRKYLLKMPVINTMIILLVFLVMHCLDYYSYQRAVVRNVLGDDLMIDFFYISVISSILVMLFAYFWQKNRVNLRYIDSVFSTDELKKNIFPHKRSKIRNRLWFVQGVTTMLPLVVVFFYMFISTTKVESLGIEDITADQAKIIFGGYMTYAPAYIPDFSYNYLQTIYYVNGIDTLLTFVGIFIGTLVALIYILFFVKWTNEHITRPVREVVKSMKKAGDDRIYEYAVVRTNDELGELTEGYNLMSGKIRDYIGEIEEMNRGLEEKVRERTAEIEAQKDEILAQRDEIEAQRDEIIAQRDNATQQRDLIMEQKKELTDSINYALRIQSAILPDRELLRKCLAGHFIFFRPRNIVSGDFYWFSQVEKTLVAACADCTGHGVPGAFMSMLGAAFLKEIVDKEYITHPGVILQRLRKEIVKALQQHVIDNAQSQAMATVKDGMDIALCSYDPETGQMQFSGANNPMYLIRNGKLVEFKGDKMPIAIYEKMDRFGTQEIQILPGDTVYLFSDGFADQFGGPDSKKFKYKPFKNLLADIVSLSMDHQHERLGCVFDDWKGSNEQVDDVTVIGLKFS
ncbi:MAG: SpoIIE family protein phosphatase [Bacteroidota bacterium]